MEIIVVGQEPKRDHRQTRWPADRLDGRRASACQAGPVGHGRRGRVVSADTGRPLRGATLRLVSLEVMRVAKTAVTDAEGKYEFTGLVAGRYQLEASAERHLGLRYGQRRPAEAGRPIDLSDGARVDTADFALPRPGAIEGVLLDEFGDPAPNIVVQIARLDFIAGRRRLLPIGNANATRLTDDQGHFRIAGLAPGDYYVTALCGAFAEQHETGGFAPTHYPGTSDAASARPVRVGFGAAVAQATFALVPARMARVSGTVMDAAGQPSGATLLLMHRDQAGTTDSLMARGLATDGRFLFRNVPPGTYIIQGFGPSSSGSLGQAPFGWAPFVVKETDVTDVSVVVSAGAWARGRIVLEQGDKCFAIRNDPAGAIPRCQ